MKMLKRLTALAISVLMLFSFSLTVSANEPPIIPPNGGDNGSNALIEALEMRIATLEATLAALLAALDTPQFVDHWLIEQQRQEAVELERFMMRMTYYGVVLTLTHNDLLIRQRDLTRRQLELENVRLELGFTTQNNVDDMQALLNSLIRQIELNNTTTTEQRRHVSGLGNFRIPTPSTTSRVRSLDELRSSLISNSTALAVMNSHINQAWQHNMSWNEIRLLEEQRDLLRRQLEIVALNGWSAYTAARAEFNMAVAERPLLQSRLEMIDELYELGEIGEVDRLTMRFDIYSQLHMADMAAIALAMSIVELDFMMQGIIGQ